MAGNSDHPKANFDHGSDDVPHTEEGDGNWLISYADMMTLLFAFFALMYALTVQNQEVTSSYQESQVRDERDDVQESLAKSMGAKVEKPFTELAEKIEKIIKEAHLEDQVKVDNHLSSLSLKFIGSAIFKDGESEISPDLRGVVVQMLGLVAQEVKENTITFEGHTDDRPISSLRFPSNWELSAQRAGTLARIIEGDGVGRKNIVVVGYADSKPVAPNRDASGNPDPEGQSKNRRVVVDLIKK